MWFHMPSPMIDENDLTKGQLCKFNPLYKSVYADIGECTFSEWMESQTAAVPADKYAERIADALWPLIEQEALTIRRGRYIVKRDRGRIVVGLVGL